MTEKEITLLIEEGIGYIHIEYSGGGDSGGIDNIHYISNSCDKMQDSWHNENFSMHCTDYECLDRPKKLQEQMIEDSAYRHLNTIEDWWNNDGGFGCLVIEIPSLIFKNTNSIYFTEIETYNHEGNFEKEEL